MAFLPSSTVSCLLSFALLAGIPACGDDAGGGAGAGGDDGSGGAATTTAAGAGGEGTGAADAAGSGGADAGCSPVINGTLDSPNGEATLTLGGDANVSVTDPGTIPCRVYFDELSGISNADGTSSGATYFECRAGRGDLYFGFIVTMFAVPAAGDTIPLGSAASVPGDEPDTFVWNGEASFKYEEGPRCEPTTGLAKVWDGDVSAGASAATGSLVVHGLEDGTITFSIEGASVPTSAVFNDAGSGTLDVAAEGEAAIEGL